MKDPIGFQINMPEGSKVVNIPISNDLQEYFKEKVFTGKNAVDYIKEFLITEKNYNIINDAYKAATEEALPECLKSECLYCTGESQDTADKACQIYILQMAFTFQMASNEFVKLVLHHPHIHQNKKVLLGLTQDFFKNLHFVKGRGLLYFDLENMCRNILNAGFISLSELFAESEALKNLQIINNGIDDIQQRKLQNEIFDKEDEDYLDLQEKFFENKQRFYKEKLFLEEKGLKEKKTDESTSENYKQTLIPIVVLYYYYLQVAGYFPYFENHNEGKIKAIEALIKEAKINTTTKYFQLKYNDISNHKTNRIAKKQAANISYVANQMLNDYPKAKEIALSELNEAQTKNR